jgi:DNA-binding NtrC family response regulator
MQTAPHLAPPHNLSAITPVNAYGNEDRSCTALTGQSSVIAKLHGQLQRVAPYFRTALLTGERSSGERDVARELHRCCPLSHLPFVELDAAGAQAGIDAARIGPLETQGLIFFSHPEHLERSAQAALLHLLRERRSSAPRIVAFAPHGLRPLVSTGAFLPELAESLSALRIAVPPLRERREDIPAIFLSLLQQCSSDDGKKLLPTEELLQWATQQPWPGNLAQMEDAIRHLLKHAEDPLSGDALRNATETLPLSLPADRRETRLMRLDQIIQEHIRSVLLACNGNKLRAAEVLGISRSTLYRMLETATPHTSFSLPG